jgi:hypothetical protein
MTQSDAVALLSALAGFVAAFYWFVASKVEVTPVWEYNPELKPKNMTQEAWMMTNALDAAFYHSLRKNSVAAIWTGISVALMAISVLAARWPLILKWLPMAN